MKKTGPSWMMALLLFLGSFHTSMVFAAGNDDQPIETKSAIPDGERIAGPVKPCETSPQSVTNGSEGNLKDVMCELTSPPYTSKSCFGNRNLNFGVLVYNPYYQISRSTGLGKPGFDEFADHLQKSNLPCPSKVIYLNGYGYTHSIMSRIKHFFRPKNYSGTFAKEQKELAEGQGEVPAHCRSSLNNEDRKSPALNLDEGDDVGESTSAFESKDGDSSSPADSPANLTDTSETASRSSIENSVFPPFKFIHPQEHGTYIEGTTRFSTHGRTSGKEISGDITTAQQFGGREALFNVMNHILTSEGLTDFHCKGGIHRTGMVALMMRYLQGGEWTDESKLDQKYKDVTAKRSVLQVFKKTIHPDIQNRAEYEYYLHNPNNFRQENLDSIRDLAKSEKFKCIAKKFQDYLNAPSTEPVAGACYQDMESRKLKKGKLLTPEQFNVAARENLWNECNYLNQDVDLNGQMDYVNSLKNAKPGRLMAFFKRNKVKRIDDEIQGKRDYVASQLTAAETDLERWPQKTAIDRNKKKAQGRLLKDLKARFNEVFPPAPKAAPPKKKRYRVPHNTRI